MNTHSILLIDAIFFWVKTALSETLTLSRKELYKLLMFIGHDVNGNLADANEGSPQRFVPFSLSSMEYVQMWHEA